MLKTIYVIYIFEVSKGCKAKTYAATVEDQKMVLSPC